MRFACQTMPRWRRRLRGIHAALRLSRSRSQVQTASSPSRTARASRTPCGQSRLRSGTGNIRWRAACIFTRLSVPRIRSRRNSFPSRWDRRARPSQRKADLFLPRSSPWWRASRPCLSPQQVRRLRQPPRNPKRTLPPFPRPRPRHRTCARRELKKPRRHVGRASALKRDLSRRRPARRLRRVRRVRSRDRQRFPPPRPTQVRVERAEVNRVPPFTIP